MQPETTPTQPRTPSKYRLTVDIDLDSAEYESIMRVSQYLDGNISLAVRLVFRHPHLWEATLFPKVPPRSR